MKPQLRNSAKASQPTLKTKKLTAVLYTRMAVVEGKEVPAINHILQEKELRAYCEKEGIVVTKVIYDVGSGINYNERKEFNLLVQQLKSGEIKADLFLYTSTDRLARGLMLYYELVRIFHFLGIRPMKTQECGSGTALLLSEFENLNYRKSLNKNSCTS